MSSDILIKIIMIAIPLIFAITMHEAAHGFIAKLRGDNTAYNLGRVSLNPICHIDPLGTIIIPGFMLLSSLTVGSPFIFGWAKPVPINYNNLKKPKLDMAFVAIAGPAANLFMAIMWAIVYQYVDIHIYIKSMALYGIFINITLMVLNLIPIPPLDGSRIVSLFLSDSASYKYNSIERYGFIILIILMIIQIGNSSLLFSIISPVINWLIHYIQLLCN